MSNEIIVQRQAVDGGSVITLIVDNERKLNTLNPPLIESATQVLRELARDDEARALVITGAGERAFVGGADINHMAGLDAESARAFITSLHELCQAVLDIPYPVIGRINGYTLGAGLEFAACCDWRICAQRAEFGMPEVNVGIPSVIEAARLPMLIGWGRTRELLLTGRWIKSDEALNIGFVEQVVADDALDSAVDASIDLLLAAAPGAIRNQKALINSWEKLSLSDGVQAGIDSFAQAYATPEPGAWLGKFASRKK